MSSRAYTTMPAALSGRFDVREISDFLPRFNGSALATTVRTRLSSFFGLATATVTATAAQASRLPASRHGAAEWTAACGTRLTLRPVRPDDAARLGELFEDGLSRAARYSRFHGAVGRLSATRLAWMATADFDRHAAFIVTRQQDGLEHAVAEGRWVRTAATPGAEFALAVADAWQRQGIGRRLLAALVQACHDQGLSCLTGDVMPGNLAMQALASGQHFDCTEHPEEPGLMRAQLSLAKRQPARAGWIDSPWLH